MSKPRGRYAHPEGGLQGEIVKALNLLLGKYYLIVMVPNQLVRRTSRQAAIMAQQGMTPGAADITISGSGYSGWMEIKAGENKQTASQLRFEENCEERGIDYAVVNSIDGAINTALAWGLLVRSADRALRAVRPAGLAAMEREKDCAERAGGGDSSRLPGMPGVRSDSAMEGKG